MTREDYSRRVERSLECCARQAVPDDVDIWPSIRSSLKVGHRCPRLWALRRPNRLGWVVLVILLIGVVVPLVIITAIGRGGSTTSAEKVQLVSVGQTLEHGGITVALQTVRISQDATILEAWYDAPGLEPLEPLGSPKLTVNGEEELRGNGGPGKGEMGRLTFGPLPDDAKELTWEYGPFWGMEQRTVSMSLPIGPYLRKAGEAMSSSGSSGGAIRVPMEMEVELEGRIYEFTEMQIGLSGFSLTCIPANEKATWYPLRGPVSFARIRDDKGTMHTQTTAHVKLAKEKGYSFEEITLNFEGVPDVQTSTWILEIENPGVIHRGPWRFQVSLP